MKSCLLLVVPTLGVISIFTISFVNTSDKPHIIFIVADDLVSTWYIYESSGTFVLWMMSAVHLLTVYALLGYEHIGNQNYVVQLYKGWNDVGFHGSSQIPTPNIDVLAYSGLILNNYYVNPICTPSRSALMTGKYPIHTGMQHGVLYGAEPRGLPLTEKLLPEYLQELGYRTHLVGKWHLGCYTKEYTPTYRGFESHIGPWTGHHDYFDHTAVENPGWGLDMRRNMDVAYDLHGQYSTDIFTKEAVKIIKEHKKSQSLFLYIGHVATHSGNPYEPLRAPDEEIKKFKNIADYNRRRFAAMLSKLDDSIGQIVAALQEEQILENSIIIFTSDNGGPAAGFNLNAASNFPLRGVKNTLWEGGVRGASFLWSPLINKSQRVSSQMMHIVDWLPTLLSAIGANAMIPQAIDGIDLWEALSEDTVSPRGEILHNIDDKYGNAALLKGQWKFVKGTTYNGEWDGWYGPAGRNSSYDVDLIRNSNAGRALKALNMLVPPEKMLKLRASATVNCTMRARTQSSCRPLEKSCLFNIHKDPCERDNLADDFPEVLVDLEISLMKYNATALPPTNLPLDERGNPKYWNYVWTNFGDFLDKGVTVT